MRTLIERLGKHEQVKTDEIADEMLRLFRDHDVEGVRELKNACFKKVNILYRERTTSEVLSLLSSAARIADAVERIGADCAEDVAVLRWEESGPVTEFYMDAVSQKVPYYMRRE